MHSETSINDAWYAAPGKDADVALSTKVKLVRNLANFPFPSRLASGDDERIQSIVIDALNHLENCDFHSIAASALDSTGSKIMNERGIVDTEIQSKGNIILRSDGRLSCSVNMKDHLCISTFESGCSIEGLAESARSVDEHLQKYVQFAASYDFGYLNSSIMDSGSGMRISLRLHLPALTLSKKIPGLIRECAQEGFCLSAVYGTGGASSVMPTVTGGAALGAFYQLENASCVQGSEVQQIAGAVTLVKTIMDMERSERLECKSQKPSEIRNCMYRGVALARSSVFVSLREAIDIISVVKLGKDLQLLTGIDDTKLHALLYRIQNGHLEFVLKNGNFNFEDDVKDNPVRKNERLRSLILQEAFEDIILAL